jgi:hypothetical protein
MSTRGAFRRLRAKLAGYYGVADDWQAVGPLVREDGDLGDTLAAVCGKTPPASTVEYGAQILRLLLRGYDAAAIATELGRTEEAIKSTRANLRHMLFDYCAEQGIDTEHIEVPTGGWCPAHHYAEWNSNGGQPRLPRNG